MSEVATDADGRRGPFSGKRPHSREMTTLNTQRTGIRPATLGAAIAMVLAAIIGTAHADRVLTHEAIIHAPVAEVWRMFTTDEGAQRWMAPKAKFDLRVGGSMRTSYNPESNLEDEDTIVNRILAYEPERMLAMRNEQAPRGFARVEQFQQTWSVMYFEPVDAIGGERTRLRVVGLGYGDGPEWEQLLMFFEIGNQQLIDVLASLYPAADDAPEMNEPVAQANPGANPGATLDTLHRLVGGAWVHESRRADGTIFRSRAIVELGADGRSLASRGWLGDAHGLRDHGRTLIHRTPDGGGIHYVNIDEAGAIATGQITLVAEGHLQWDWPRTSLDGATRHFRADMRFEGPDAYVFTLSSKEADGTWRAHDDVRFTRER